jgi:hypothetical protein
MYRSLKDLFVVMAAQAGGFILRLAYRGKEEDA